MIVNIFISHAEEGKNSDGASASNRPNWLLVQIQNFCL